MRKRPIENILETPPLPLKKNKPFSEDLIQIATITSQIQVLEESRAKDILGRMILLWWIRKILYAGNLSQKYLEKKYERKCRVLTEAHAQAVNKVKKETAEAMMEINRALQKELQKLPGSDVRQMASVAVCLDSIQKHTEMKIALMTRKHEESLESLKKVHNDALKTTQLSSHVQREKLIRFTSITAHLTQRL